MSIKIAVSGKLGAGKTTFFELARAAFPELDFIEGKFAAGMYKLQDMIQTELEITPHKDGKLLQFLGTHYKSEVSETFWVDRLFKHMSPELNEIITDCRFPVEVESCKRNGFKLVRIERQLELRLVNQGNRDINHISETALDSFPLDGYDYVINNNGSFELFEEVIVKIIKDLLRNEK